MGVPDVECLGEVQCRYPTEACQLIDPAIHTVWMGQIFQQRSRQLGQWAEQPRWPSRCMPIMVVGTAIACARRTSMSPKLAFRRMFCGSTAISHGFTMQRGFQGRLTTLERHCNCHVCRFR